VFTLADDTLDFDARVVAEVHEQAHSMTAGLEVIVNLCPMLVG
jgi:hypothetical protein